MPTEQCTPHHAGHVPHGMQALHQANATRESAANWPSTCEGTAGYTMVIGLDRHARILLLDHDVQATLQSAARRPLPVSWNQRCKLLAIIKTGLKLPVPLEAEPRGAFLPEQLCATGPARSDRALPNRCLSGRRRT